MGGFGSGRRSNRLTVEECITLRLTDIKQLGLMKDQCMTRTNLVWRSRGQVTAEFTITSDIYCREAHPCLHINGTAYGRKIEHYVLLDAQPMRFGGVRWYALCTSTGKRCTTLVLMPGRPVFISRMETKLPNITQRMDRVGRAHEAIEKAEKRLRRLSKYARRPTRDKLTKRIDDNQMIVDMGIERIATRIRLFG